MTVTKQNGISQIPVTQVYGKITTQVSKSNDRFESPANCTYDPTATGNGRDGKHGDEEMAGTLLSQWQAQKSLWR